MTQQSNTPETDGQTYWNRLPDVYTSTQIVEADFARKLERERDEARKERDQLRKVADELADSLNRSNYYYSVQQYNNLPHVIAKKESKI